MAPATDPVALSRRLLGQLSLSVAAMVLAAAAFAKPDGRKVELIEEKRG